MSMERRHINILPRRRQLVTFTLAVTSVFGAVHLLQSMSRTRSVQLVGNLCTHGLLRKYYQERGYFPSAGVWKEDDNITYFQPNDCQFRHPLIQRWQIAKCFLETNLTYVAVLGDSNGAHNFQALISLISARSCQQIVEDPTNDTRSLTDRKYFSGKEEFWVKFMKLGKRSCRTCINRVVICHVNHSGQSATVQLEFLRLSRTIDQSVVIAKDGVNDSNGYVAGNSQEFYFKYYFKHRYPNVLVIFPPFNHDKRAKLSENRDDLKRMKNIVDTYVPETTRIFFMPSFSEFENKRQDTPYFNMKFHGYTAARKISWLNHKLYETLENDLLRGTSNIYGFFDMFTISKSRDGWSTDGVHVKDVWYLNEMSMFLQLFCNRVEQSEF